MKLVLVCLGSWLAGLAGYTLALGLLFGQTIAPGDLSAVMLWSGLAFLIALPLAYLPGLRSLRRLFHGTDPAWVFPLLAALLGIVPVEMISLTWGGGTVPNLLSAEFGLFDCMFATTGLVLGIGFVWLCPKIQGGKPPPTIT